MYCALCIVIVSKTDLWQKVLFLKRDVAPKQLFLSLTGIFFWRYSSLVPLLGTVLLEMLK